MVTLFISSFTLKQQCRLGLSYHSLDPSTGDDFIVRMSQASGIPPIFSVCLSEGGGALVLSGTNLELFQYATPLSQPVYVPLSQERFYAAQLRNFGFQGQPSPMQDPNWFSSRPTIFDTGSTFMNVPSEFLDGTRSLLCVFVCVFFVVSFLLF